MKRYIALADCDCFFVSAERAFNRKLDGKAVAVLSNNEGCVVSRSKEAKALGLKMGEPYFMAKHRVPDVLYIKANHDLYTEMSEKVMNELLSFTPEVEVCSIDEAFIDLTGTKFLYGKNYIKTLQMIRNQVWIKHHIPLSIGISDTKILAKLASDKAKSSGGIFAIGNAKRNKILATTKIDDISGIGRKLIIKMREELIFTALDFVSRSDYFIKSKFGKHGTDLKAELTGNSLFKVQKNSKAPLSIQQTAALREFSSNIDVLRSELCRHIHSACRKARSENAKALAIEVMLRTKDFRVITEKTKLNFPSNQEIDITPPALELLDELFSCFQVWRSVGITLCNLVYSNETQMDLFNIEKKQNDKLGKALDELEQKFGKNIVHLG